MNNAEDEVKGVELQVGEAYKAQEFITKAGCKHCLLTLTSNS